MSSPVAGQQREYGNAIYWYCRACKIQEILAPAITRCRCPRCRMHMKWQNNPEPDYDIVDDSGKGS